MEQATHEREINEATLLEEPLHLVFWSYEWTVPKADRYQLIVRATDGTGRMQTSTKQGPRPRWCD
jgi:hypothetical protein